MEGETLKEKNERQAGVIRLLHEQIQQLREENRQLQEIVSASDVRIRQLLEQRDKT